MAFRRPTRNRRARREPPHFAYSRWDGSQTGFDIDADHLFDQMADDLIYGGDPNLALRKMMQSGFKDRNGRDMAGLREMMERLRERRREVLENHDLGGVYDDIADALKDVVRDERRALDQMADAAKHGDDARAEQLASDTAASKQMELDMLPPDLAGQVKGLQNYQFESA